MKVTIEGDAKEIAALAVAVQERLGETAEDFTVGFPSVDSPYAYASNLVAKHNDVSNIGRSSE